MLRKSNVVFSSTNSGHCEGEENELCLNGGSPRYATATTTASPHPLVPQSSDSGCRESSESDPGTQCNEKKLGRNSVSHPAFQEPPGLVSFDERATTDHKVYPQSVSDRC